MSDSWVGSEFARRAGGRRAGAIFQLANKGETDAGSATK